MIKLPPKGIFSSPRGHVATVNGNISLKSPLFTAEESDVANYNILKTPERNVNSVARYTKREVSVINSANKTSKTPGNTRQVSNSMERSRNEKHDSTKKKKVFTGLGVIYSPNEDTKIAYTRTHMVPREILEGEIIAKLEILKSLQGTYSLTYEYFLMHSLTTAKFRKKIKIKERCNRNSKNITKSGNSNE